MQELFTRSLLYASKQYYISASMSLKSVKIGIPARQMEGGPAKAMLPPFQVGEVQELIYL